jgi:hypothetical protein
MMGERLMWAFLMTDGAQNFPFVIFHLSFGESIYHSVIALRGADAMHSEVVSFRESRLRCLSSKDFMIGDFGFLCRTVSKETPATSF